MLVKIGASRGYFRSRPRGARSSCAAGKRGPVMDTRRGARPNHGQWLRGTYYERLSELRAESGRLSVSASRTPAPKTGQNCGRPSARACLRGRCPERCRGRLRSRQKLTPKKNLTRAMTKCTRINAQPPRTLLRTSPPALPRTSPKGHILVYFATFLRESSLGPKLTPNKSARTSYD